MLSDGAARVTRKFASVFGGPIFEQVTIPAAELARIAHDLDFAAERAKTIQELERRIGYTEQTLAILRRELREEQEVAA